MARTVRDALKNLDAQELKRFKDTLNALPDRPSLVNIPEVRLLRADALDLSRLLVGYYGPRSALEMTVKVLEAADCKAQAEKLRELTGIGSKSAGAGFQHRSGCRPRARKLHRVPELSRFSDIPGDSVWNRSGGRRRRAGKLSCDTSDIDTGYEGSFPLDFTYQSVKRLAFSYPELTDDDYEGAFDSIAEHADEVNDYECTVNSITGVRTRPLELMS